MSFLDLTALEDHDGVSVRDLEVCGFTMQEEDEEEGEGGGRRGGTDGGGNG